MKIEFEKDWYKISFKELLYSLSMVAMLFGMAYLVVNLVNDNWLIAVLLFAIMAFIIPKKK